MSRQLQLQIDSILAAPPRSSSLAKSAAELEREVAERLLSPDPERVAAYEEKLEAKRDRLEAASAKHAARSQSARASARARGDMIPFGQPILVGHHSERRHRSDIAKIDAGMRKSFAEADRAGELARAAARVGTAGISSDDPAAVVKLKEELAGLQRAQEMMKQGNAILRKLAGADDATQLAALKAIGLSEASCKMAMRRDFSRKPNGFSTTNGGANVRRVEKRIAELALGSPSLPSSPPAPSSKKPTMAELFAAAQVNGYPRWNPETHPYRVSYAYYGHHYNGELSETAVFATEAEARVAFAATMPKRGIRAMLDRAENADDWQRRGRWKRIESRRRGAKPKGT